MNDELNGQLTTDWRIPAYAQRRLYLQTESDFVKVEGDYGLFQLTTPAPFLTLRWWDSAEAPSDVSVESTEGAILAYLNWQPDALEWDGQVCIGGYLDALHLMTMPETDNEATCVLYMGGNPLKMGSLPDKAHNPYSPPHFHKSLAANTPETTTTWFINQGTPAADLARDAILHNMRVYLYGRLAEEGSLWEKHFALPLLLGSMTLFSA